MTTPLPGLGAVTPRTQTYFPTANGILNIHLGGGLLFGHMNEIHGNAGFFKTTFCAESIKIAQDRGAWIVIHDREERLNTDRLESIGADPHYNRLVYLCNTPYVLTIERVFETMRDAVNQIRQKDCEAIIAKLKKKPSKTLVKRYLAHLGMEATKKPASIIAALTDHKGTVFNWHLLPEEDRSEILWVVDSVTAMPSISEVAGDKPKKSAVVDRNEVQIRQDGSTSSALGQSARSWSTHYRCCTFMDAKICGIATAQMRTAGIGSGQTFQKAAQPGANEFYARTRLYVYPMAGGPVYADPKGGFYFNNDSLKVDQKWAEVGRRLWYQVRKTSNVAAFRVPGFMIGTTGTDNPNTTFEFLRAAGLIKSTGQKWSILDSIIDVVDGAAEIEPFTRAQFVEHRYTEYLKTWAEIVRTNITNKVQL